MSSEPGVSHRDSIKSVGSRRHHNPRSPTKNQSSSASTPTTSTAQSHLNPTSANVIQSVNSSPLIQKPHIVIDHSTSIHIIHISKKEQDIKIDKQIESYMELQFIVAKYTSIRYGTIVQYANDMFVTPSNFKTAKKYIIREIPSKFISSLVFFPQLPADWEYREYQGLS